MYRRAPFQHLSRNSNLWLVRFRSAIFHERLHWSAERPTSFYHRRTDLAACRARRPTHTQRHGAFSRCYLAASPRSPTSGLGSQWLSNLSDMSLSPYLERFPFALAHGTRSSSLFESVIHRSGDSTCADHALGSVFFSIWSQRASPAIAAANRALESACADRFREPRVAPQEDGAVPVLGGAAQPDRDDTHCDGALSGGRCPRLAHRGRRSVRARLRCVGPH
jgi:hypothetical protein